MHAEEMKGGREEGRKGRWSSEFIFPCKENPATICTTMRDWPRPDENEAPVSRWEIAAVVILVAWSYVAWLF